MEKIDIWRGIDLDRKLREITKLTISIYGDKISNAIHSQLDEGVDGEGKRLPIPYSVPYAKKRIKAGLQISNKDLNFSGNFRSKAYVLAFENFMEIGHKSKLDPIFDTVYGKDINKPNDSNLEDWVETYLKPAIWRELLRE